MSLFLYFASALRIHGLYFAGYRDGYLDMGGIFVRPLQQI